MKQTWKTESSLMGDRCLYSMSIKTVNINSSNLLKDKWLSNPAVNPAVTFLRKLFTVFGVQNIEIFMKIDRCYRFWSLLKWKDQFISVKRVRGDVSLENEINIFPTEEQVHIHRYNWRLLYNPCTVVLVSVLCMGKEM